MITIPQLSALYRRVSTNHQDNSLAVQETLNDEYCRRNNMPTLESVYEDADVSGSIPFKKRGGGKALMARLQFGDVRHLVTAKQDRLGRDTLDTIATIREIWGLGIVPHFPAEGGAFPRTPQNELLFEIKASVAQYERNLIRDRTRAVLGHKFSKGELTGNVPYGYDCLYTFSDGSTFQTGQAMDSMWLSQRGTVLSKVLVPNLAEQSSLRQMASWRTAGWSLKRIADELNSRGQFSKLGRPWQCGNVDSVLKSRHTQRLLYPMSFEPCGSGALH